MAEYIEKQAAVSYAISGMVRALPTNDGNENWIRTSEVRKNILSIPAADVAPVVHGKWTKLSYDGFNCNKCGSTFVIMQGREDMHFCPNCGAKMDGDMYG